MSTKIRPIGTLLTGLLLVGALWATGCAKEEDSPPPPTQSAGGPCGVEASPPENIPDFPCPPGVIKSWVAKGQGVGSDTRGHGWYLLAGLNQEVTTADGLKTQNWRTWPTSTEAFPGQYDEVLTAGVLGKLDIAAAMGGARLERPVPSTPGHTKADLASLPPGISRPTLTLPNPPSYAVPTLDNFREDYASCLLTTGGEVTAVKDGAHLQNNGDVMIGGVIYNGTALESINGGPQHQLWNAAHLDALLPENATDPPAQVWMEDNSIALKTMLWPVPGDGFVPLPIWDTSGKLSEWVKRDEVTANDGSTICEIYSGFERQALWKDAVALTAGDATTAPAAVTYLVDGSVTRAADDAEYDASTCKATKTTTGPITYSGATYASLDDFYTQRFTADQFQDNLGLCDRALIDQSAIWSYGRRFDPSQDALVLIAMHIMTKEQTSNPPEPSTSGWTFQSAWWSNCEGDACGGYDGNRPSSIDVPGDQWNHYLITSTYGMTQKSGHPKKNVASDAAHGAPSGGDEVTDDWPVAFNPYIELAATHPVETNCINCHRRAGWPGHVHPSQRFPDRAQASYLAEDGPSLLHTFDFGNAIFEGQVTVDSMWAISDRAYYPAPSKPDDESGE
ncbi:MAG: hypothetical protein AAGM22_12330 [Acidobacteriota bacterium]